MKLDTVALDEQREAVLLVTSGHAPGEYDPLGPGLEAELAVVRSGGKALTVLSRERVPTPSGVGEYQASVSTALDGKKGEKVIRLETKSALEFVKLEVLAVYPGSRHADACVSEVDFSDVQAVPVPEE